jgi:hypothetical protein
VRLIAATVALFTAGVLLAPSSWSDTPPPATVTTTVTTTRTVRVLATYQGKPTRWWATRAQRNRREVNRLVREWQPTVNYAIGLACTVYRVPCRSMHAVASCESGHNPAAVNGQYRGIFQEGPMFERGPFAWLGSVFDPLLNALTAAYTVAREGWREWECKP